MAAYRGAAPRGASSPDDPYGDVFLVVDGWSTAAPGLRGPGARDSPSSPPAAWASASTSSSPPPAGRRCRPGCATCSAPGSSCGWATRSTPRSTSQGRRTCPPCPGRGLTARRAALPGRAAAHRRRSPHRRPGRGASPTWSTAVAEPGPDRPRPAVRLLPHAAARRRRCPAAGRTATAAIALGLDESSSPRSGTTSTPTRT